MDATEAKAAPAFDVDSVLAIPEGTEAGASRYRVKLNLRETEPGQQPQCVVLADLYPSESAALSAATAEPAKGKNPAGEGANESSSKDNQAWSGSVDIPDAIRKVRAGVNTAPPRLDMDIEGAKLLSTAWEAGRVGAMVSVPMFAAGSDKPMLRRVKRQGTTQHVRLVVTGTVSSGMQADAIRARGAVVAAAVDVLEQAGHRVELSIGFGSTGYNGSRAISIVPIKQWSEPIDWPRLQAWLTLACASRRIGFRLMEHWPRETREQIGVRPKGGYGMPFSSHNDREALATALQAIDGAPVSVVSIQNGMGFKESPTEQLKSTVAGILDSMGKGSERY